MIIFKKELCAVCNQCILVCPAGALEGWTGLKVDEDKCVECYECIDYCPTEALEVRE